MRLKTVAVLAVFAAGLCPGLRAQGYRSFTDEYRELVERSRWALGPLKLRPSIAIRDVGYDDNLYYGSDDGAPVRDFTAAFSPGLEIAWPVRNILILRVRDHPEYVYYHRESFQRAWTNSYGAGFRLLLPGRFVLSGDSSYDVNRRRVSSEFQIPATDRTRGLKVGLYFETPRKTALGLTGIVRTIAYDDLFLTLEGEASARLLDREEKAVEAEAYYQIFTEGFLFLRGGVQEYRFTDRTAGWRDASAAFAFAGLRFPLLGRVRGVLNLGYKDHDPRTAGESRFRGWVGDSGLEWRPGRLAFHGRFSRDLVFSVFTGISYFIETAWAAGGAFYPIPALKLEYRYSRGRAEYPERSAGPDPILRADRRQIHNLSLILKIFESSGIGLTYQAESWTSSLPGFDRRRHFVGAILTRNF